MITATWTWIDIRNFEEDPSHYQRRSNSLGARPCRRVDPRGRSARLVHEPHGHVYASRTFLRLSARGDGRRMAYRHHNAAAEPATAVAMTSEASNLAMLMLGFGGFGFATFLISRRTKDALAAAKARGVKLGGFRGRPATAEDRALAVRAVVAKADARAADLAPISGRLDPNSSLSLNEMARRLTAAGLPTVNGSATWTAAASRASKLASPLAPDRGHEILGVASTASGRVQEDVCK